MLERENTVLLFVDVQGKLAHLMHNKESLFENLQKLVKGILILNIPIIWLEQNPDGLGGTVPELARLLAGIEQPISKFSFSCCGEKKFIERIKKLNRNQILLAGIEAHICIYQTAMDLNQRSYDVQVVADAVSSRIQENKKIALDKIRDAGAGITSVETALFELLKVAKGDEFKEILKIVK